MSFSDLVGGGAACGPSNPLQSLGKRFGADRSTQFDRFGSSGSQQNGAARGMGFRASPQPSGSQSQQQQELFQHGMQGRQPLDMAPLHGALPIAGPSNLDAVYSQHSQQPPADFEGSFHAPRGHPQAAFPGPAAQQNGWSNDFLASGSSMQKIASPAPTSAQLQNPAMRQQALRNGGSFQPHQRYPMGAGMLQRDFSGPMAIGHSGMYDARHMSATQTVQDKGQVVADNAQDWNDAFTAYDAPQQSSQTPVAELQQDNRPETTPFEADELARTAGRLVSTVEHDQNDKFKQSNFLNLMRKLRDREAGIQGTDIVESEQGMNVYTGPTVMDKGKGKAVDLGTQTGASTPKTQHEAYLRMRNGDARGHFQLPPNAMDGQAKAQDRQWLRDLWADEDARSEAIEERARQNADTARQMFVGDGGDVAARMQEDDADAREFAKYQGLGTDVLGAQSRLQSDWEEDMDEASKEDFVGRRWEGTKGRGVSARAQAAEWDKLQADWDAFEAGPNGLQPVQQYQARKMFEAAPVPRYEFRNDNPYLQSTRNHLAHTRPDFFQDVPAEIRSILESEAAVQMNPNDSESWYNLGVKQQENEREMSAIAALHRAVELNPSMKEAWLALAVSYTNENDRTATFESIERWIDSSEKYAGVVAAHRVQNDSRASSNGARQSSESSSSDSSSTLYAAASERHARMVSTLLAMARHGSQQGEVDADIQVALGVLFNASDDFSKAVDCFSAAISVRPEDWILYNRLGAVLSNSGRSQEALEYYRYALELKPDFARCHFNLAISCLNLKMYSEAAEHCFTALTLQQADDLSPSSSPVGAAAASVPSAAQRDRTDRRHDNHSLWETLRVSLELGGRTDMADRARRQDISLFHVDDFVGHGHGHGQGGTGTGTGTANGLDEGMDL